MDDGGNVGEQRTMRRVLDHDRVRVALDTAQRSPAAGDHGTDPGLLHSFAHDSGQMGGIGTETAAEADVDGRCSRGQETFEVGMQRFCVRSLLAQPEAGGNSVQRPVCG